MHKSCLITCSWPTQLGHGLLLLSRDQSTVKHQEQHNNGTSTDTSEQSGLTDATADADQSDDAVYTGLDTVARLLWANDSTITAASYETAFGERACLDISDRFADISPQHDGEMAGRWLARPTQLLRRLRAVVTSLMKHSFIATAAVARKLMSTHAVKG